ncbi:MAG: uracil-DNA glycosylase [Bacteroidetes bacterium]|nr:uracil-DNA glycosylase [Bacteroidota bacterium]
MSYKKIIIVNKEIKKCRLSETRINALCGEGNTNAKIMFIAQDPGENEDREGRMFIGPSGKVLDKLFIKAGINRKEIYMTNLIKCMLPKNRKPKQDEIKICSNYLNEEIKLVNPKMLVPLGYYAIKYIFQNYNISFPSKENFHKICGNQIICNNIIIFPLQHPASVLYDNSRKDEMTKNYIKLKTLIDDLS